MTIFEAIAFFNLSPSYTLADLNKARNKMEQRHRHNVAAFANVKYRHKILYKYNNVSRDQIDSAYNICYNYLCFYIDNPKTIILLENNYPFQRGE